MNIKNGNGKSNLNNDITQDKRVILGEDKAPVKKIKALTDLQSQEFDQSILLRQSPIWSRSIMISLMVLGTFGIVWANVSKIEQVVPATGQLKPQAAVKEVQAPINGVVKTVAVKDGQKVNAGDLLLTFDTAANKAELDYLNKLNIALIQENQIYNSIINSNSTVAADIEFSRGKLSREAAALLKNRSTLITESLVLRNQLGNSGSANGLGAEEQIRLQVAKQELDSRAASAQLQVEQTRAQLAQNSVKIQDNQTSLAVEQDILNRLKTLDKEGAIAKIQYLRQKQRVDTIQGEIGQLIEEQRRLQFSIAQGRQQLNNTVAVSNKNVLDKIAENRQRVAEIDTQLSKILLENEKRLAEVKSKITQVALNVKYQELRAPVAGTIFDLKAKMPGFVANPSQEVLKIVPNDGLVAEVFITNKDIGFVQEGMKVDVRIEAFPFSEFGDIKGEIIWIGSDALPPEQNHPFYRFPARVRLQKQNLNAKGREISLQSGMALTANIKIREERTVMSLFTELFTKQVESIKEVR
jgi:hemolysin D